MNSSYSIFAKFYDLLTDDIDYKKRATFFDSLIKKYGNREKTLLDLACGTGSLSKEFIDMGYSVTMTDMSGDMLDIAKQKVKKDILILKQSMQNLCLPFKVSNIVCALDSINHIENHDEVEKTFSKVANTLEDSGLFIFDVNTLYKHKYVLADNTFVDDREDIYLVWDNIYNEKNKSTDIYLDFFVPTGDISYDRHSEHFCEKFYSYDFFKKITSRNGLNIIKILKDDILNEENNSRLIYICKKERR